MGAERAWLEKQNLCVLLLLGSGGKGRGWSWSCACLVSEAQSFARRTISRCALAAGGLWFLYFEKSLCWPRLSDSDKWHYTYHINEHTDGVWPFEPAWHENKSRCWPSLTEIPWVFLWAESLWCETFEWSGKLLATWHAFWTVLHVAVAVVVGSVGCCSCFGSCACDCGCGFVHVTVLRIFFGDGMLRKFDQQFVFLFHVVAQTFIYPPGNQHIPSPMHFWTWFSFSKGWDVWSFP